MPEGDTIHRIAARLRPLLAGRELTEVQLPRSHRPVPPPGTVVTEVTAHGKHLLVHLDSGEVLHVHLRMTGRWSVARTSDNEGPATRGRNPTGRHVVARLTTDAGTATCLDAPVCELIDGNMLARHPELSRLGPDLITSDEAVPIGMQRLVELGLGARPVGEALLDQRVVAGIGNVYANEVAFLAGIDPRRTTARVPAEQLRLALLEAQRLLRANLKTRRRTTANASRPGSLWVYGRTGRACLRCDATLRGDRLGRHQRTVTWCPTCQPPADQRPADGPAPPVPG